MQDLEQLLVKVKQCTLCQDQLPVEPRPCLRVNQRAKILIIGQAPGLKVYQSGILFDDLSGQRLIQWLGVDKQDFYNSDNFAILPMGFCYTGKGKYGDNPPMKVCASTWHKSILAYLQKVELILLVGSYAQKYYLNNKQSLTNNVQNYNAFLPKFFPLPHPSARNFIWLGKNPWFGADVLPELKDLVRQILKK
ncbi:uracil-DNA glycosylase family protein [Myroides sp. LJL119]